MILRTGHQDIYLPVIHLAGSGTQAGNPIHHQDRICFETTSPILDIKIAPVEVSDRVAKQP